MHYLHTEPVDVTTQKGVAPEQGLLLPVAPHLHVPVTHVLVVPEQSEFTRQDAQHAGVANVVLHSVPQVDPLHLH